MALTLRIVGSLGESLANRKLDPADYFRVAREESRFVSANSLVSARLGGALSLCRELHHFQSEMNARVSPEVGGPAENGDCPRNQSRGPPPASPAPQLVQVVIKQIVDRWVSIIQRLPEAWGHGLYALQKSEYSTAAWSSRDDSVERCRMNLISPHL